MSTSPEPNRVADRVCSLLRAYNETTNLGWVYPDDTSFRCFPADPARIGLPDAAFISFARMPTAVYTDEGHCQSVPDVVVEVVATDDRADQHMGKVMAWLTAGVRIVWELFPKIQRVYVTRPDGGGHRFQSGDTLTAPDVLPGFTVVVAEFFRLPGEPSQAPPAPVS